ncbi:hypothetical protein F4780DRAFT_766717 [Xylariomycetidae sp. FL0641]|nr:hypothetical protein F4780DRAFT_766717 [Xylariomycetidae sp. FL0641]
MNSAGLAPLSSPTNPRSLRSRSRVSDASVKPVPAPSPSPSPATRKPKRPRKNTGNRKKQAADEWYTLRDILDEEKTPDGGTRYLIDWEGTDHNGNPYEPSWEPARNVTEVAIAAWEKLKKQKQKQKQQEQPEDDLQEKAQAESQPGLEKRKGAQETPRKAAVAPAQTASQVPEQNAAAQDKDSDSDDVPLKRKNWRRNKRGTAKRSSDSVLVRPSKSAAADDRKRRRTDSSVNPLLRKDHVATAPDTGLVASRHPGDTASVRKTAAPAPGSGPPSRPSLAVELQQPPSFVRSEFQVISPSRSTQHSSQSTCAGQPRSAPPRPGAERDERIIPDSQAISGTTASEVHSSLSDHYHSFTASQAGSRPTTSQQSLADRSREPVAPSTQSITSRQIDPRSANVSKAWTSFLSTTDLGSGALDPRASRQHQASPTPTNSASQESTSGKSSGFVSQLPLDADVLAPTPQPAPPSRSSRGASVGQDREFTWANSEKSYTGTPETPQDSQSSSISSQAAQIVLPLTSHPADLSTQSQGDFSVYDEDSAVTDNASSKAHTQQSSQRSQALSELDRNTRSAPQDQGHEPGSVSNSASASLTPTPRISDIDPFPRRREEQPATSTPLQNWPQRLAEARNSVVSDRRPATPAKMDTPSAGGTPLSARERFNLLADGLKKDFETFGSRATHASPENHAASGDHGDATINPKVVEKVEHGGHSDLGNVTGAETTVPIVSPSPMVSYLHNVPANEVHSAPDLPDVQAGLDEEQVQTLDPAALTLSIEHDADASESVPTDDDPPTSLPMPLPLASEDDEVPPDYPASLLRYVPCGANEYLVTLPFHPTARSPYNDILREGEMEMVIKEYNAAFLVSPHQTPQPRTVAKVDEMFTRLFDICDYPPFLETIESLPSKQVSGHLASTNSKFAFISELLDVLRELGAEKKILILARPGKLLDLLGHLIQAKGLKCFRAGQEARGPIDNKLGLSVAVSSTADDPESLPKDTDVVIAFDHTFRQDQLPARDEGHCPMLLVLTNTASIQHLNMRIKDNLGPLERKNILILALVKAMQRVEEPCSYIPDPDKAPTPFTIAETFARQIHASEFHNDDFYWEPDVVPENVFDDLYAVDSQPSAQKRAYIHDDDDELPSKRPKTSQPEIVTETLPMSEALREFIGNDIHGASGQTVTIPLQKMENLVKAFGQLEATLQENKEHEARHLDLIDNTRKEVESHEKSVNAIQTLYMEALKERGEFEAGYESQKEKAKRLDEALDTSASETSKLRKMISGLQEKLSEANELLTKSSNPDIRRMASIATDLEAEKTKAGRLEKRLDVAESDRKYAQNQYQETRDLVTELKDANRTYEKEIEELRRLADATVIEVNKIQSKNEVRELTRMLNEQKNMVRDRELELIRLKEEVKTLRNSRRETRGSSVPRSPRLSALGVMSPRNGTRGPSAMGGASSRGTSPASAIGGPEGNVLGNPSSASYGQAVPNSRFNHLRDPRF